MLHHKFLEIVHVYSFGDKMSFELKVNNNTNNNVRRSKSQYTYQNYSNNTVAIYALSDVYLTNSQPVLVCFQIINIVDL